MSFDTIKIVREIPIINSYVQLENNNPANKTTAPVAAFVAATGGLVNRLSQANKTGRKGGRNGTQEWVEFDTYTYSSSNAMLEYGKTLYGTNTRTDRKKPWED
jgi:hypothetical protein